MGSGSRLGSAGSHMPSLLRPTASFAVGVEATARRRQLLVQQSPASTYKPKVRQGGVQGARFLRTRHA